jgi:hypothetical protein
MSPGAFFDDPGEGVIMPTVKRRIERLEEARPEVIPGHLGDPPQIVITWPGDETPEVRAANREARKWYKDRGLNWQELPLVLNWADGSGASLP